MINPTDPPTDQQIHCFKPTINQSQPTDPTMTQTPDPTHFSHNTRPKYRTQPTSTTTQTPDPTMTQTLDPTTTHNPFRHRSQPKKKKKPQPQQWPTPSTTPKKKKKQPQNRRIATHRKNWATVMCDVCWEENGVWVWREERADWEREKEEREDN